MRMIAALLSGLVYCSSASADWSTTAQVEHLNVGGNGLHGTFVALEGYAFSGCSVPAVALVPGNNPNYKEILATLLSAKAMNADVRVGYSGCSGSYATVTEVILL
jgi:hypothetical protein